MLDLNLYFYYKNRQKIRNSFLLESVSSRLKNFILQNYRKDNYRKIDVILQLIKFLIFSIAYFLMINLISIPSESLYGIGLGVFIVIGFMIVLVTLSMNKLTINHLKHDHYFRMLSEQRSEYLRQTTLSRVNQGFIHWLVPLAFPIFIYASIYANWQYLIQAIVIFALYYLFLFLSVFSSQSLFLKHLRKSIIIIDVLIYFFSALVVGFSVLLHGFLLIASASYPFGMPEMVIYGIEALLCLVVVSIIARFA